MVFNDKTSSLLSLFRLNEKRGVILLYFQRENGFTTPELNKDEVLPPLNAKK